MNKFEAVILLSPDLTSSKINKIEDNFKKQLTDFSGELKATEDWGLRDLSYNINKNKKAFYKFYQIELDGNKIQDIKKIFNQNEQILRYLFIKVNNHSELPTKLNTGS